MVLLNPKWPTTNVLCLAWKTWNRIGPSNMYNNLSRYNKPSRNSNLSKSIGGCFQWLLTTMVKESLNIFSWMH
jgi:hypothetical protein